jgi:hypothetical protein
MENKSTHDYQMALLARRNKQLITAQLSEYDYALLALIASDRGVPLVQLASELLLKGICD